MLKEEWGGGGGGSSSSHSSADVGLFVPSLGSAMVHSQSCVLGVHCRRRIVLRSQIPWPSGEHSAIAAAKLGEREKLIWADLDYHTVQYFGPEHLQWNFCFTL